jgi:hypothetical protein
MRRMMAALALTAAAGLAVGCGSATSTSPTPPAAPVSVAALDGMLLDDAEAVKATGANLMEVGTSVDHDTVDDSANVSDSACLFTANPAEEKVYAGSGWIAIRSQMAMSPDVDNPTPYPIIAASLVLFPSADEAAKFFAASAGRWPACANKQFTLKKYNGKMEDWAMGPISNDKGMLSATRTVANDKCQMALTVRNNVVVDVSSCGYDLGNPRAINFAEQLAAKIPTT